MSRRVSLAVVLGFLTLPAIGRAQYGDGYAAPPPPPPLMPFNPNVGFNPMMSPEWQQMMMQKMAAQEQAAFQQEVQAYQAWAKANPKEAAAMEKAYRAQMDPNAGATARRTTKKKTATKAAATKGAKPLAKGAKPVAKGTIPPEDAAAEESPTAATAATAAAKTPAATTTPAPTTTPPSRLRSARQGAAKAAAPAPK